MFANARQFQFCPSSYSRNMLFSDPHNIVIVFCPYIISLYNLAADPGRIYAAYRRPAPVGSQASREALQALDELLAGLIREALEQ